MNEKTFTISLSVVAAYVAMVLPKMFSMDFTAGEIQPITHLLGGIFKHDYQKFRFHLGSFPVFMDDHVGTIHHMVTAPFFWAFGAKPIVLRIVECGVTIVVALIASRTVARLKGDLAGVAALFLVLLHSASVIYGPLCFLGEVGPMQLFVVLAAYAYVRWLERQTPGRTFLWSLAIGLGVYAKFHLLWQALVYTGVFILRSFKNRASFSWKATFAFVCGLCLSPSVLVNLFTGGLLLRDTVLLWFSRFDSYHMARENLAASAYNWTYVLDRLSSILKTLTLFSIWETGSDATKTFGIIFRLLALGVFAFAIRYLYRPDKKDVAFRASQTWILIAAIHAGGVLIPFLYGGEVLLPILPLLLMVVAVAVTQLINRPRVVLGALLVAYSGHFWTGWRNTRYIPYNGMSILSEKLLTRGIFQPVILDPVTPLSGLDLLTSGRILPRYHHAVFDDSGNYVDDEHEYYDALLTKSNNWYVVPLDTLVSVGGYMSLKAQAHLLNKGEVEAEIVYLDERPTFRIFRMENKTADSISKRTLRKAAL